MVCSLIFMNETSTTRGQVTGINWKGKVVAAIRTETFDPQTGTVVIRLNSGLELDVFLNELGSEPYRGPAIPGIH